MGRKSNQALAERVRALPIPASSGPKWVVSGGGVGFLRPAPGSWGTAVPAALLWWFLCLGMGVGARSGILLGFGLLASVLMIVYGKWAAAYFRQPDPGTCILDEYAGFAVTAALVPVPPWCQQHGVWGFFVFAAGLYILFRLTDTLKIPPANWLERLPWGWGILCDDLAAGIQANLAARFILWLWLR
jgi:phosphatidylglycerophosphatase A